MSLIDRVKAQVPLENLLQSEGFALKKMGTSIRSDSCPHCGTKKDSNRLGIRHNRYHCFSCGGRGDVVDATAALRHLPVFEAARWLEREFWVSENRAPQVRVAEKVQPPVTPEPLKRMIARLHEKALRYQPEAFRYLNETRGIPRDVIEKAVDEGILRFLPSETFAARDLLAEAAGGREALVELGLMRPGKHVPAAAFRPICWFFDGMDSIEFRLAKSATDGSRKALRYGTAEKPSTLKATVDDAPCVYTEGLIDTLSMVGLGFQGEIRGIPGVNTWRPEWFLDVDTPVVCFDGDRGGRRAAEKVRTVLMQEHQKTVEVKCPDDGDINDLLIARLRFSQQEQVSAA